MSPETDRHHDFDGIEPLEQVLAQFAPAAARVDRDRLLFLAGAASSQRSEVGGPQSAIDDAAKVRRGHRLLWPAATAGLAATSLALALALGVAIVLRPQPRVEIVYVERPAAPQPANVRAAAVPAPSAPAAPAVVAGAPRSAASPGQSLPVDNYLRTREVALRMGLDALGTPRSGGGGSAGRTYLDWLSGLAEPSQPAEGANAGPRPQM